MEQICPRTDVNMSLVNDATIATLTGAKVLANVDLVIMVNCTANELEVEYAFQTSLVHRIWNDFYMVMITFMNT